MDPLRQKLAHLPDRPGVYLFRDARGKVLYVGKARRLDHRVRSYFGAGADAHPKTAALVERIADLETIVTDSDVEALLLEMTLIKEKRPPYNIRLRDDKRFPFLKITLGEPYPKAVITRRTPEDGSRYFGPFTDAGALRRTLKTVRAIFPIRSCMGERPGRGPRYRECLDFHIHRCAAPCIDEISADEYRSLVERLCGFLAGQGDEVVRDLTADMEKAAASLDFERAARLRDRLRAVERMMRRQKMLDTRERDRDVLSFARDEDTAYGTVLQVRGGRVLGRERRVLRGTRDESDGAVMAAFLTQYYAASDGLPAEVVARPGPEEPDLLRDWLARRAGSPVKLTVPERGKLRSLARLAEENARLDLEEARGEGARGRLDPSVYALQQALGLTAPPAHIEGFDISNIQGAQPVASLVVFRAGQPARAHYRRFRMRTRGPNDFAMMAEAVGRRAARIVAGEFDAPDLLLIDGGVGQVGAAVTALQQEGLGDVPVIGLAKREETLVRPGGEEIRLPHSHEGLKLLIRVRNEAHRFAVTYHRGRRTRETLASELDGVAGIGKQRKLLLLNAFGSVGAIRSASVEEIAAVPGIGRTVAERIHRDLTGEGSSAA